MAASLEMVAVVAMARNRVIGDGAGLIWHLPADLKRVKSLTMGCPLIMGRRTWDSIGRALPGRASVVMTRDARWAAEGALRAGDMDAALALSRDWIAATQGARPEIILFGGG
ncbi:MAG: dihydrofolate reductase, partial [SAR116 cluster bacterium]|nr:dihydrofolate reductase [SAR116 cluster bacterium]